MVGFCTSPAFVKHRTSAHHPERPDRIRAIARAVRAAGLVDSRDPYPDFQIDLQLSPVGGPKLIEIEPTPIDSKWLRTVHQESQIEHVRHVCQMGGGILDQSDTPVGPESFEIAMLAAGGVTRCCDTVMQGQVQRAFAAIRPPGHHAEPDRAMGFCLFGNVAIAARYLQKQYGLEKVAIVDFDVHHGNGTQAAFENDPSVLFISIHQHPATCYPGTGYETETGEGAGHGTKLNIPMMPGSDDDDYLRVMEAKVLPKLDLYQPQMLLLSAGFDAHREDPLAQIDLSESGFEGITRMLVGAANTHCGGKIVSVLEGGYSLRALGRSVVRHLVALRDF